MNNDFSTKTIIAFTNIIIDIEKFFKYMPVYDICIECKNSRKKRLKDLYHIDDKVETIPDGSLICVKWNNKTRGVILKTASVVRNYNENKKKRDKYFLNSVTTNLFFKSQKGNEIVDKLVNIKITKTGKFQITGCKNDDLAIKAIHFLYKNMIDVEKWTGEKLFTLEEKIQKLDTKDKCVIILQTVMKNRNVHIGFTINREALDLLINRNYKDYISIFDGTTSGAGVNVKTIILENDIEDFIYSELTYSGETSRSIYTGKDFESNMKKKNGYHTFLCFKSGSCIHSGRGNLMIETFNNFIQILHKHRNEIEEK